MKLLPNKTFPHPVLWKNADDYVRREFQVMRDFSVGKDDVPVLSFKFVINEEHIIDLLKGRLATYVIEIYCPTTCMRRVFSMSEKDGKLSLKKGELYRRVEVNAFVVCTQAIHSHSSHNFNKEFGDDASFSLVPGDVLAAADTEIYYWDTECVAPLHSVFDLVAIDSIALGMFAIDTEDDKVKIQMHPADKARFDYMRHSHESKPTAMFVYFSAVAEILRQMKDAESDGGKDKKWYRAIEHKLNEMGKSLSSTDPFMLAQELLRHPLGLILPRPDCDK